MITPVHRSSRPTRTLPRTLGIVTASVLTVVGLVVVPGGSASAAATVEVTISGSTPTVIVSGLKKNDKVTIEATLSTTDPNENGEGEPLVLQSSGGFSVTQPEYELGRAFSFTATTNGESLSASIAGADGDETARIKVGINSATGGLFSQETKEGLHRGAVTNGFIAAGAVATGVVCPPCGVFTEPFAAGVGLVAAGAELLSLDPADPRYRMLASPTVPSAPQVGVGPGVTAAEVTTFNALMDDLAAQSGLSTAASVSFNREAGAILAGDRVWAAAQHRAGLGYLHGLGQLVRAQPVLTAAFLAALKAGGYPSTTVTPDQALAMEIAVNRSGLPAGVVRSLKQLGADDATIAHLGRLAAVQDINVVAGTYLAKLADPAVTGALDAEATALLAAA